MGYYDDIYKKRLNRYGTDFASRIQRQREENFKRQLQKSVYYVTFKYNEIEREGEFTPLKQNQTKTLHYLLTDVNLDMPHGTILEIPNKNKELEPWLVYYLEDYVASGYNRYIMLKMTHYLTWRDRDGAQRATWAYFYGQEDNMLKEELKSRSRNKALYTENLKLSFFITPFNENLLQGDYFEVSIENIREPYVVTGIDRQSNPGVMFVSVDPRFLRDLTPPPERQPEDSNEDFFWLKGGVE